MRNTPLASLAALLSLAAACGTKAPATGKVAIKSAASAKGTSATTPICAQFTLQPFYPSSDGSVNTAGAPLVINSSQPGAVASTDAIAGCIDGPNDTAGYNWGYIVTASNFSACGAVPGTLGAPLGDVSPKTETFIVNVHCRAGLDEPVSITAQVSIATANAGGYLDISTSVNATEVQVGCKQADIGIRTDHKLHFGESYLAADGSTQTGIVALDTGAPTQFGGTVNGPSGAVDTFYTGLITPSSVNTIYQTFASGCTNPAQVFADTHHAQCISNNGGLPDGTVAQLADAFIEQTGHGFAAASVVNGGLQIYSSMAAGAPATMTAGASFAPAYNPLNTTVIPATDASLSLFTITGVYPDQGHAMQFLVSGTANDASPAYASLRWDGAAWVVSPFLPVDSNVISCNGLYGSGSGAAVATAGSPSAPGCSIPKDCSSGQGSRTIGPIVWLPPPPLSTYWLYVFYAGSPAARPLVSMATTIGEPNLSLDPAQGAPTYGIRFANKLLVGTAYNVTVASTPANTSCIVQSPTGTMTGNKFLQAFCGPSAWKQVAGGGVMGNGIATDGTLWAWGNNYYNTLGTAGGSSPMPVGTDTDWKQVAGGYGFNVALKNSGTLWAWGTIYAVGIGDGTNLLRPNPVQLGTASDWVQVAATVDSMAAIKSDGTLWIWGYNDGSGASYSVPTQVGTATDWSTLDGGQFAFVMTKTNHSAWFMGAAAASSPTPVQVGTTNDFASGSAGNQNIFLLKQNGTLWAMGYNADGGLGNGTLVDVPTLTQIGTATTWSQLAAGFNHTVALRTNGDVYAWGLNNSGQLGNGTLVNSASPVLVGSGYSAIAASKIGSDVSWGLKTTSKLWGWGSNATYNLGLPTYPQALSPVLLP